MTQSAGTWRVFARRWWLGSVIAVGLVGSIPACHEEVSLGAWPDLQGSLTSGTGGAPSTMTAASASTSASAATTSGTATDGGPGPGGAAGAPGEPPPLPACLTPGTPGPVNPAGPDSPEDYATDTNTDWTWPTQMTSLEWELMVEREIVRSPASPNVATSGYYYAHQFYFVEGATGFLGIQAEGGYNEDPDAPADDVRKIAVFWLSGPLEAELGDDLPAGDSRVGTQDVNGLNYLTIHARFDWQICRTYRFRFAPHSSEPDGTVWYGAWIKDLTSGVETFLGRMRLPAGSGALQTVSTSRTMGIDWVKRCGAQQHASVLYGTPTANDGALVAVPKMDRWTEPFMCAGSRFTHLDGAIRHELGVPQ